MTIVRRRRWRHAVVGGVENAVRDLVVLQEAVSTSSTKHLELGRLGESVDVLDHEDLRPGSSDEPHVLAPQLVSRVVELLQDPGSRTLGTAGRRS